MKLIILTKKVRKTVEERGWRDVTGREFYPALYEKQMSLNRKFNFECHDIITIGNDMISTCTRPGDGLSDGIVK